MNSIGLNRPSASMEHGGEPRLSDYRMPDLWALWWRVGRALAVSLVGTLRLWVERYRQRIDLHELDGRMLRDIGVTPEQAGKEARKRFWQY
jgi:uncharacterized protein YjiS (DUF1127 family)